MPNVSIAGIARTSSVLSATIDWVITPFDTPTAVGMGVWWDDDSKSIVSVTFNGVPMVFTKDQAAPDGTKAAIYGLASPADGAQHCVITFDGVVTFAVAGLMAVQDSDLTTCFDHSASASGNGADQRARVTVVSAASAVTFGIAVSKDGGVVSADSVPDTPGQSHLWSDSGEAIPGHASYTTPGAASIEMIFEIGNPDCPWAAVAASFKPAGEAPPADQGGRRGRLAHWRGGASSPVETPPAGDGGSMTLFTKNVGTEMDRK